ncbi:hypothetical protein L1987_55745 [Smallanthus sonchifolius]|uniref:Uncharacterized protein n=1 Tax=Smallanthus sonchifolius TaxID=185202 RepID=A0ACB9EB71_9ASTR|nr:hypothetical protein L1987_55745 [Smallanthus sonchifolius]
MATKGGQNKTGSPKVEVGEIDTRAPFQSVKEAVNLFGEGAFSSEKITNKKIKPHAAERALVKETKLNLAQKEISKLKEQLQGAETTKTDALTGLERAKRTVEDLTKKLEITNEAKRAAVNQAKLLGNRETNPNGNLKQGLENTKEQYAAVFTELNAAKLELRSIRHDRETTIEEQNDAKKQETESDVIKKVNLDRAGEISKEIISVQEAVEQVKQATMEAQQEQEKVFAEKKVRKLAHKAALEESTKKLLALRERVDPENSKDLETQFAETTSEVKRIQTETDNVRASDLDSLKTVTSELVGAKDSLQKVVEEESSLKKLLESLKTELENIKKEHEELKEKEAETESVVGNPNSKLQESKIKLENACVEEAKVAGTSDEMLSTFQQVIAEDENAKRESEEMKGKADELKKEAEAMQIALKEAESKLKIALKAVEAVKVSEKEAVKKLEAAQKEIDGLKVATKAALKRAEIAETCRKAVEGELKRWRDRGQKKAAETVALILQETQTLSLPSTPNYKQSTTEAKDKEDSH